jgi:hypothetical protein
MSTTRKILQHLCISTFVVDVRHRTKPEAPSINIIKQRVAHAALTCTTLAMDPDALTTYQMDLADEEDDNDMDWDVTATAAATIVVGAVVARQRRAEQRLERRLYLTRAQLLPNPRRDTPWQILYASKSDRAYITTMGFDVQTFEDILEAGFSGT